MPVNTAALYGPLGQRLQQALDEHVGTDLAHARLEQLRRIGQRGHAERPEQRAPVAADQPRRQEQRERVDETRVAAARPRARRRPRRAARSPRARPSSASASSSEAAASASTPAGGAGASGGRDAHDGRSSRRVCASLLPAPGVRDGRTRRAAAGARPADRRRAAGARGRRRAPCRCRRRRRRTPPASRARARRLSGEEIQRLSPVLVAMRPSSVAASLSSTNGRPRTTCGAEGGVLPARTRLEAHRPASSTSHARRRAAAPGRGRRPRDWDRRWRRRRARCPRP